MTEPASRSTTEPTAAGGSEEPMREVVDRVASGFSVVRDAQIRCDTCRTLSGADEADVLGTRRLEGASDPADMSMVHVLRCPACGVEGALVTMYGPEASEEEADVLLALGRGGDRGMAS